MKLLVKVTWSTIGIIINEPAIISYNNPIKKLAAKEKETSICLPKISSNAILVKKKINREYCMSTKAGAYLSFRENFLNIPCFSAILNWILKKF